MRHRHVPPLISTGCGLAAGVGASYLTLGPARIAGAAILAVAIGTHYAIWRKPK